MKEFTITEDFPHVRISLIITFFGARIRWHVSPFLCKLFNCVLKTMKLINLPCDIHLFIKYMVKQFVPITLNSLQL